MKSKRLFAAMLCAITLLTGCSEAPSGVSGNQSSSVSVPSYFEGNSSSTESSSSQTESSESTSSSTMSSSKVSSTSSPKTNETIKDTLKPWIIQIYDGESNGKHLVEYYYKLNECKYNYNKVRVYVSPDQNTVGRIAGEFDHKGAQFMVVQAALTPGTNYYRVQLIGNNVESQISSPYEYTKAGGSSGSSSVATYTHTFTAPSYLTVIPDYSEALAEIECGVEPDSFSVSVQFTCPGCGNKRTYRVWMVEFPYSRDGKMPFNAECGMTNCPYRRKEFSTTIESHAVRIS